MAEDKPRSFGALLGAAAKAKAAKAKDDDKGDDDKPARSFGSMLKAKREGAAAEAPAPARRPSPERAAPAAAPVRHPDVRRPDVRHPDAPQEHQKNVPQSAEEWLWRKRNLTNQTVEAVARDSAAAKSRGANPFKNRNPFHVADEMYEKRKRAGMDEAPPAARPRVDLNAAAHDRKLQRRMVEQWDKANPPKPTGALSALARSGFLGKEAADKDVAAARQLAAAAEAADLTVPDPAFDDHDSPTFDCENCKTGHPRSNFSRAQLLKLSDCKSRTGNEGPWKGTVVRLHNKHYFSFINSPLLQKANEDKDCFLNASMTEMVFGGMLKIRKALEQPTREFMRVEFHVQVLPDGRLKAKEPISRVEMFCKLCENQQQKRKDEADAAEKASATMAVRPIHKKTWHAGTGSWQDSSKPGPQQKGSLGMGAVDKTFDAKSKLAALLQKTRVL